MTTLPSSAGVLVIGAGVHGLSTAWHLAQKGERVLVVDKDRVAAGASGIACGVVRNNYFQPAMSELMAACVEIWESDPDTFHYHGSGYIRSEEHTSELQSLTNLVCRLLLEKKNKKLNAIFTQNKKQTKKTIKTP